jgi:hypothetical protein
MIHETSFSEWSLREEIFHVTHRWPVIVMFCLVGSLLGLAISFCLPSPHRATKELYVGLNVYKATEDRNASEHAGLVFSDPNDYKNWQMANLNSLIFMDTIMDDTLMHLRTIDPYWSSLDKNELARMLHAYWRNAGKWRLVAENDNPLYAMQAVLTWEGVVVDRVHDAVYESQQLMILDRQLESLTLTQTQAISRTVELMQIRATLNTWQTSAVQQDTKLPVHEIDRELISNLLYMAEAGNDEQRLLDTIPSPEAPLQDYISWLDSVYFFLDQQILVSQTQITTLENRRNEFTKIYADSSQKSLGLSANLQVDKITTAQPEHTVVRPSGMLILIGGILGLITWAILWLTRISLHAKK